MDIFRISKQKYAGAKTASGYSARWNRDREHVIYCASSRALASLEIMVHTSNIDLSSTNYKITVFRVPDDVSVQNVHRYELPEGWNGLHPYNDTQAIGSRWYNERNTVILRVPSSIIRLEYNYLINVTMPEFERISVVDIEDFIFDKRLLMDID